MGYLGAIYKRKNVNLTFRCEIGMWRSEWMSGMTRARGGTLAGGNIIGGRRREYIEEKIGEKVFPSISCCFQEASRS